MPKTLEDTLTSNTSTGQEKSPERHSGLNCVPASDHNSLIKQRLNYSIKRPLTIIIGRFFCSPCPQPGQQNKTLPLLNKISVFIIGRFLDLCHRSECSRSQRHVGFTGMKKAPKRGFNQLSGCVTPVLSNLVQG